MKASWTRIHLDLILLPFLAYNSFLFELADIEVLKALRKGFVRRQML